MTEPLYTEFTDFLRVVHNRNIDKTYSLIKAASNNVIRSIIEIGFNALKGDLKLSNSDKARLSQDKQDLKRIISKKNTIGYKRTVLENNPRLVKNLLRTIF